jgi:hypothetical protein
VLRDVPNPFHAVLLKWPMHLIDDPEEFYVRKNTYR